MPDTGYVAATLGIAASITFTLRAVPFAIVHRLRTSATITYLGRHLPSGIMIILVAYLLRDAHLTPAPFGAAQLVPVAATVAAYTRKRHMLLAMTVGTLTYALMLTVTT